MAYWHEVYTMFGLLVKFLRELGERPGTTLNMKLVFRLRFMRVRGRGMSSPSRCFHEPVRLSVFVFVSFPNAYESNNFDDNYSILFCA